MSAPSHLFTPALPTGRHAHENLCPEWCDPRRCVAGDIHIGTSTYWPSTVADIEFGLARYQDPGEPEAFLLTLRRLATVGTAELVVSAEDLQRLPAIAARLRNAEAAEGESTEANPHDGLTG